MPAVGVTTDVTVPSYVRDFYEFDLIIGMDDRNIDDLKERAPSVEACGKIHRMTEYCTKFAHADYVPDPYYGGAEGFEYGTRYIGRRLCRIARSGWRIITAQCLLS
mgnify:CR=1 FL=1